MKTSAKQLVAISLGALIGIWNVAIAQPNVTVWISASNCQPKEIKGYCKATKNATDPYNKLSMLCQLFKDPISAATFLISVQQTELPISETASLNHIQNPVYPGGLYNRTYWVQLENAFNWSKLFHATDSPLLDFTLPYRAVSVDTGSPPGGEEP